jgi:hypothetical protein
LEQRATGYRWPIDSSGSAVKVATFNSESISSSHAYNRGKFSIFLIYFINIIITKVGPEALL